MTLNPFIYPSGVYFPSYINALSFSYAINLTIPEYLKNNPALKISLLHIDVDVYRPTLTILEYLFDRVVNNGIIVLDDYATVNGETRAIDEFILDKKIVINKLSLSHLPSYIVKT